MENSKENSQIENVTTVQQTGKSIKLMSLAGTLMIWGGLAFAIWGADLMKVVGFLSIVAGLVMVIVAKFSKWWNHS